MNGIFTCIVYEYDQDLSEMNMIKILSAIKFYIYVNTYIFKWCKFIFL